MDKKDIEKYWNAMRYGSKKTRVYVFAVLAGCVITAVCLLTSLVLSSWVWGLITLFFAILTIIIWQSGSLTDKDFLVEEKEKKREKEAHSDSKVKEKQAKGAGQEEDAPKKEKEEKKKEKPISYDQYTQATIAKSMHRYRVKSQHRTVMIDSWESKGVKECPAYLWKDRKYAYLMLLEGTPRRIRYPIEHMLTLLYVPGVPVKEDDYASFKKTSFVASVFRPYLPDTYQDRKNSDIVTKKNLYSIAGDLFFTNTSARNVLDVLGCAFVAKDAVTKEKRHGGYFVQCYHLNILLRDSVLTVKEYQEKIKETLQGMAQDRMKEEEFQNALAQMVRYRFITDEFAEFFQNYRKSWLAKQKKGHS